MIQDQVADTIHVPDTVSRDVDVARVYGANGLYNVAAFERNAVTNSYDEIENNAVFTPGLREYVAHNAAVSLSRDDVGPEPRFGEEHR